MMSKVYWNPKDAPYLTQQIRRNIILRWIRRPLPDFEECAACDYIMRRIWNSGQRRRSSSFYSRSAALHIWHATYLYQDFTRIIQDNWRTCAAYKIKLRRIWRRCTNIPEYNNLGPHAKLSRCAASTYSMRRIDPQTEDYKYPKTIRI